MRWSFFDMLFRSATEVAELVRRKEFSSRELTEAVLARIEAVCASAPGLLHKCSILELDDRPGRAAIPLIVICQGAVARRVVAP